MAKGIRTLTAIGALLLLGACSSSPMTTPVANGTSTASSSASSANPAVSLDVAATTTDGYPASLTIVVQVGEGSSSNKELLEPLRVTAVAYLADHTSTELLSKTVKQGLADLIEKEAAMLNGVTIEAARVTDFAITL